jgi:LPPG:FO 2-phospho-L-lactate transferase
MIVALAGGVGGARLSLGLAQVLPPAQLAIVVNTGDDFEHLGLNICPDLDTVVYTLAGVNNLQTGWGRADERWTCMETLAQLGGETWFSLGDRDLALNLLRTTALRQRMPLSAITRLLAANLGVRHRILPMSDTPVRTRVHTSDGRVLGFQDYFVRLRCRPRVEGFAFDGVNKARVPPELRLLIDSDGVEALVICPSNPYVSIAPILSVPGIRRWLRKRKFPVVGVSPIIGGAAVKGPAAKMMRELGAPVSTLGIARHYGALVDGWVIDRADTALGPKIEALHHAVAVTDTLMTDRAASKRLARTTIAFARKLARRRGL